MDLKSHIIESTIEIFEKMLMIPVTAQEPLTEPVMSCTDSISGMLGFSGDFRGILSIHCPEAVAIELTGLMLGVDVTEIDSDVKDAIGEISNMVTGGIKHRLLAEGTTLDLSIPSAIFGKSYCIKNISGADWVGVPFRLDSGEFIIEIRYLLN